MNSSQSACPGCDEPVRTCEVDLIDHKDRRWHLTCYEMSGRGPELESDACPDCGEIACCEDTHGP